METKLKHTLPAELGTEKKEILGKIAGTIRQLAMDATQKANSGHPGLPMGCAEIGAYLWGVAMRYNPNNPNWLGRDRFVLSAGHGCLLQYACLHLSGYDLSLDDLKNFRQLHSKTPGHPEKMDTPGIETTTGPLGQGVGNGVGTALGLKLLGDKFNKDHFQLFGGKVIVLAGDGCIMEGISSEVSSLAGHMRLDNFILIYDSNKICLDGPLEECCSEDTAARYRAYGFDVYEIDGHNFDAIHKVFHKLYEKQDKPCLIIAHTIIGKGAPNKAGTHHAHGSPLGTEEVKAAKQKLGLSDEPFFVPQTVRNYFETTLRSREQTEEEWNSLYQEFKKKYPEEAETFEKMKAMWLPADLEAGLNALEIKEPTAGRSASYAVIQHLAKVLPQLYGGSADLSGSDKTMMEKFPLVVPGIFTGRNIKYGVREFGMATMATGLTQTQMILPFIGTFLTFSDYMRNGIRLAALQRSHVIYQFTHDSVFLGEDGPTHQPVEHYAALRAIPNLHFIRPGGAHEVKMAWIAALRYQGPTAIALSRQNVAHVPGTVVPFSEGLGRGGYIVKKESKGDPAYVLLATGSELPLAVAVADKLEKEGHSTRVVSLPCFELFDAQSPDYRKKVLGTTGKRVSIEAGVEQGWHKYIGLEGIAVSINHFGASAPAEVLAEEFGFTPDAIVKRIHG